MQVKISRHQKILYEVWDAITHGLGFIVSAGLGAALLC